MPQFDLVASKQKITSAPNHQRAFASHVCAGVIASGHSPYKATAIANVIVETGRYIEEHQELMIAMTEGAVTLKGAVDDARKVFAGIQHMDRASLLSNFPASARYGVYSWRSANGVFASFLSHIIPFAKSQGVELNECVAAVSRTSLAIVALGTGTVTLPTGFGAIVLLLAIKEAASSGYALGEHCILPLTK